MTDNFSMPFIEDFDEFKTSWQKKAGTPEQTILHYINAALVAEDKPQLADAMMTVVVSKKLCADDSSSPSGMKLSRSAKYMLGQIQKNANIAKSYVGGHPDNDYAYDKNRLVMTVVSRKGDDNKKKIFIKSGGKDFDTPTQLAKNKHDQWKLIEFSSIATGVKKPKSEMGDF